MGSIFGSRCLCKKQGNQKGENTPRGGGVASSCLYVSVVDGVNAIANHALQRGEHLVAEQFEDTLHVDASGH